MEKTFVSYAEQIEKLQGDKKLKISDREFASATLKNISYYALIGGYKHPFIDEHTRKYMRDAAFENIVDLYYFDEELRGIFFKYLCRVERKIRSVMSYHFTEIHGVKQQEYLNPRNYSDFPKYQKGIFKLIDMLRNMANKNTDHEYLIYQRNKYHDVPLWVLMNALTFGQISKMYEFLPQNIQGKICQNFVGVKKNEMVTFLKVLTLYRNLCAHSERLFSYRTYIAIPNMMLHEKLKIQKNGLTYAQGKNDLFSVVIAFRYLLPKNDFSLFKKQLIHLLKNYLGKRGSLEKQVLLQYMGFPEEWEKITRYKIV